MTPPRAPASSAKSAADLYVHMPREGTLRRLSLERARARRRKPRAGLLFPAAHSMICNDLMETALIYAHRQGGEAVIGKALLERNLELCAKSGISGFFIACNGTPRETVEHALG